MSARIVIFGSTGYSGQLTAEALVKRGHKPVLAGRSKAKLIEQARQLGGLDYAVADVDKPSTVRALVERGDVLVSLVGPFVRWGAPAVHAAADAGAHYLDSTGEPPFIREVFDVWGPKAAANRCGLVTAMGYDYVPGNLAAGLAAKDAAGKARRISIGYFVTGPVSPKGLSGGTRASLTGALFESGFARRGGRLVDERAGVRYKKFDVGGKGRSGISVGMSEHFAVPQAFPEVTDVETYLGWFGPASAPVSLLARTGGAVVALPPVRLAVNAALAKVVRGSTGGPDEQQRSRYGTLVVAEAYDSGDRQVGRAVIKGLNPYDFTGQMLAWGAEHAAARGFQGVGALGPQAAFGLDDLQKGVAEAGLQRVE